MSCSFVSTARDKKPYEHRKLSAVHKFDYTVLRVKTLLRPWLADEFGHELLCVIYGGKMAPMDAIWQCWCRLCPPHPIGVLVIFTISVVPINRITIRNSRLLGNFLTIGISRFYDCTISLLKSDNFITLYILEIKPNLCNKFANFDIVLQFCVFYCIFVAIGIGLKYPLSGI